MVMKTTGLHLRHNCETFSDFIPRLLQKGAVIWPDRLPVSMSMNDFGQQQKERIMNDWKSVEKCHEKDCCLLLLWFAWKK